jgi:squalene synthase HpnC
MKIESHKLHNFALTDGGEFSVSSLDAAYDLCEKVALGHYENFPVGSFFIPKVQRKYVFAVYTFARIADDIADEIETDTNSKLEMLDKYRRLLLDKNDTTNPIFLALRDLNEKMQIPTTPYEKLLNAFSLDSDFKQPENYNDLFNYCSNSANPVGELILRIFNIYDEKTSKYSDNICTGLQLVNFWQDFSLDLIKNRVYIPKSVLSEYELNINDLIEGSKETNKLRLLKELFDKTQMLFDDGKPLIGLLKPFRLKLEIAATINGGECILDKAKRLGTRLFTERPKIGKWDIIKIMINAVRL